MTDYLFHSYYINLDHRTDRKESILKEFDKISEHGLQMTRIAGVYRPDFGILGCGQSHSLALLQIMESSTDDDSLHIIFEDDFQFSLPCDQLQDVLRNIYERMITNPDMHVFCLGANVLESTAIDNICIGASNFELHRIHRSQAHSGYIIKKSFAPILLKNYQESESMLIQSNFANHPYCFDVYVQHLQHGFGWYTFFPKVGRQTPGYSDIQNSQVDHKC